MDPVYLSRMAKGFYFVSKCLDRNLIDEKIQKCIDFNSNKNLSEKNEQFTKETLLFYVRFLHFIISIILISSVGLSSWFSLKSCNF